MSDWGIKHLGELLDRPLAYGVLKPGPYEARGIPLVRIQDHKDGEIKSNSFHKIPLALHQEFRRTELRAGDIIISVVGTIGRTAIIPKYLTGANVSRAFAVIGCSDEVDVYFLDQYLKSDISQSWFREQCQGNAQQVLNLGTLREYPVPIPPLPEQKKIAEILSGIDKAISARRHASEQIAKVHRFTSDQIFRSAEKSSETIRLGDCCSRLWQGVNTAADRVDYKQKGVPILQAKHITSGAITIDDARFVSEKDYARYSDRFQPRVGDILFTNIGTIGKSAIVTSNSIFLVAWNIFLISPNEEIESEYLGCYLQALDQRGFFLGFASGNATKFVNKSVISDLLIPLPPKEERLKICAQLRSLKQAVACNNNAVSKLLELKKALSTDLLSGRKRVTL